MLNDPLANALSLMKNAEIKGKGSCIIQPSSKLIGGVLIALMNMGIGLMKHTVLQQHLFLAHGGMING